MVFQTKRWTMANILPMVFVLVTSFVIWFLHMAYRLQPMLRVDQVADLGLYRQGVVETSVSQFFTVMTLVCFLRAIFTDPGSVPDTNEWKIDNPRLKTATERKHTGEARFCKWCKKYKPDRCHHCRVCHSCVLRMDHHCPWIANCIGFRNHKYFMLLITYAVFSCLVVVVGMTQSVVDAVSVDAPDAFKVSASLNRFLLVFGLTASCIMCTLLLFFVALHMWLMLTATTTIELCEKRSKMHPEFVLSYSLGTYENLKQTFGPNPLFWLLPFSPPLGNGISFEVAMPERGVLTLLAEQEQREERSEKSAPPEKSTSSTQPEETSTSSMQPKAIAETPEQAQVF